MNASILLTLLLVVALAPEQARLRIAPALVSDLASLPDFDFEDHLTYLGGYKTPNVADNEYSGEALAFYQDPTHGETIYMETGFALGTGTPSRYPKVLQYSIPTPVDTSDTSLMNTATQRQAAVDVTEGTMTEFGADLQDYGQFRVWGMLEYGGRLCFSAFFYYDADGDQRLSHGCNALNFSSLSFAGWDVVWNNLKSRHVAGAMAVIPANLRTYFGDKPVITTAAGTASIISHLPAGLAAFAFDPAEISGRTPNTLTGHELMNYDGTNPMVAGYDISAKLQPGNTRWNRATSVGGAFIPVGYNAIVFIGVHSTCVGLNCYCYGEGTSTLAAHATVKEVGPPIVYWCYNPRGVGAQGDHALDPVYYYWVIRLSDLAAVKAGTMQPYQVEPHSVGTFTLPTSITATTDMKIGGVAYNPATKKVYLSQSGADPADFVKRPIHHVLQHP
jgi:hypothetical protein